MPRHTSVLRSILTRLTLACLTWLTGSYAERHGLPAAHLLLVVLWVGLATASLGMLAGGSTAIVGVVEVLRLPAPAFVEPVLAGAVANSLSSDTDHRRWRRC